MTDSLWLIYPAASNQITDPHLVTGRWQVGTGWSSELVIGGAVADKCDVTALQVRGLAEDQSATFLQLFYAGSDGGVQTIWQDLVSASFTTPEQNLGGNPTSNIAAVMAPGPVLDLFYAGRDGAGGYSRVRSIYQNAEEPRESWSAEQNLGGTPGTDVTAIVAPSTEVVQLFYAEADGGVYTIVGNNPGGLGPAGWSSPRQLGATPPQAQSNITAILVPGAEGTQVVQLFYVGLAKTDMNVYTLKQNPDGTWPADPTPVNLGGTPQGGDITAVLVPGTELVQLFYAGGAGTVLQSPGGGIQLPNVCSLQQTATGWSAEQNLGGTPETDVTAIVNPHTGVIQLFYLGIDATTGDSGVFTLESNPDGTWPADPTLVNLGGTPLGAITAASADMPPGPCAELLTFLQEEIAHDGPKITVKEGIAIAQQLRSCYATGALTKGQYEWGVWALNTINKLPITPPRVGTP
jgi:hypothetical protein